MNLPLLEQFGILAEGDWFDLIWVIGVVVFYLISAIIKSVGNRGGKTAQQDEETKQAVQRIREAAKQRKAQQDQQRAARTLPYARAVRDPDKMSDWDRQQEIKRQELAARRMQEDQAAQKRREIPLHTESAPQMQSPRPVRQEPPPLPVAQPITEDTAAAAAEMKRQQYYAKAQIVQQARRHAKAKSHSRKPSKISRQKEATSSKQPEPKMQTTSIIHDLLKNPDQLKSAILLKEILDKPVGMRDLY